MHTIRLRRPWLRRTADSNPPRTVDIPEAAPPNGRASPTDSGATDSGIDNDSPVTYQRSFNCPTGLQPGDSVWLLIEGAGASQATVTLNESTCYEGPATSILRIELTPHLQSSNQVTIRLESATHSRITIGGGVSLQIESTQ